MTSERRGQLTRFLQQERHWVFLGIAYLAAWWIPVSWLEEWWLNPASLFAAQPLVLLGFFLLLWGRRAALAKRLNEIHQHARYSRRATTEGPIWVLLVGCVVYFVSHFIHLALAAVLGLVLILLGVLLRVYGKAFLKALAAPITFLMLIVPWLPESASYAIERTGLRLYSSLVGAVLTRRAWVFHVDDSTVMVQGVSMPTHEPLRGMHGIVAIALFFLWYGLYRRLKVSHTLTLMTLGGVVAFLGHLCRFFLVVVLLRSAPAAANRLAMFNSWPFTLVSLALTFGLVWLWERLAALPLLNPLVRNLRRLNQALERTLDRLFAGSGQALGTTGKVINTLLTPVLWPINLLIKGVGFLFNGLGRSTKQTERWIQQWERRRRKRKR